MAEPQVIIKNLEIRKEFLEESEMTDVDEEIYRMQRESWFFRAVWRTYYEVLDYLWLYGWPLLGAVIGATLLWNYLQPKVAAWLRAREEAARHKDEELVLAREARLLAAREALQRQQRQASRRAAELQAEREEEKRREAAELLEKHGVAGGRRLGREDGYLPLSGGGSVSSYRAPKRSACSGGGCGR